MYTNRFQSVSGMRCITLLMVIDFVAMVVFWKVCLAVLQDIGDCWLLGLVESKAGNPDSERGFE